MARAGTLPQAPVSLVGCVHATCALNSYATPRPLAILICHSLARSPWSGVCCNKRYVILYQALWQFLDTPNNNPPPRRPAMVSWETGEPSDKQYMTNLVQIK